MSADKTPSKYEAMFRKLLREGHSTMRSDKLGTEVNVPFGYTYHQGANGKGIAVAPGSRTREDRFGQLHEVPHGFIATDNPDGSISVHPQGQPAKDSKSSTVPAKAARKPVQRLSQLESLRLLDRLNRWIWGD